ncbi:hypothetical protein ACFWYW_58815 [Nonomuraea sp. NPDC059023]|uniref:hypothetical protein n=1 Tax=unclassified Nonomuraea TaxID=2593643 RepID=UPI00367C0985
MPSHVDSDFAELKALLFPDPDTVFPDVWYTPLWQERFRLLATIGVSFGSLNYLAVKLGLDPIPSDAWGPRNVSLVCCAVLRILRFGLDFETTPVTAERLAAPDESLDPPPNPRSLPAGKVHRYGR